MGSDKRDMGWFTAVYAAGYPQVVRYGFTVTGRPLLKTYAKCLDGAPSGGGCAGVRRTIGRATIQVA